MYIGEGGQDSGRYLTGKREEAKKVKLYKSTTIRHRSILGGMAAATLRFVIRRRRSSISSIDSSFTLFLLSSLDLAARHT